MALAISNVPVLTGEVAESFIRRAEEAKKHRASLDYSRQYAEMKKILARAKFE